MARFEKDLTSGSVAKNLIVFALPFMLSNLIQSLYNIADMLIVGRYIGKIGISGVSIGGQVTFIMTNIALSVCAGGTIIVAQYVGAKDRANAGKTIATLLTLLMTMAIVITMLMLVFDDAVLRFIKTPQESYQYAKDYLAITITGVIFIYGYNALSGVMRGLGDSKTPLYLVTCACVINVVLDILFVGYLDMSVKGAAFATIISQAFSMCACIYFLVKSNFMFDFKPSSFRIDKSKLRLIVYTGIPIIIQNVATNLSFLAMTGLANGLGVTSSAALGIVARYNAFAMLPSMAVGASVSAMVAQNIGAKRIDRAKHTMMAGIWISYLVSTPIFLMTNSVSALFIGLFDKDPDLIRSGVEYLNYFRFDYIIVPLLFSVGGLVTGSGHTLVSSLVGIGSSLLIRVPLAIFLVHVAELKLAGIGLSAPIATGLAAIVAVIYYFSDRWQRPILKKTVAL
ncbi:MAG: MATE family efflux transporter [Peptostreptococcaceae bacterium]|nr:MATE family efflux transporter [Peptostreptococcaceae bacterium]